VREGGSHRRAAHFERLRGELLGATESLAALGESLAREEEWDLFLCGFGATHRGGHLLWGLPESRPELPPREGEALRHALRDVYAAADAAVGRLVDAAGDGVTVVVFSLHGMGPNTSRAERVLPRMLARVLAGPRAPAADDEAGGALDRLRRRIPVEWRSAVRRRLPVAWQDGLTAFWRTGGLDWSRTRALCQVADAQGYVRVNLRGRERDGIVPPGAAYDALCREIAAGLVSFRDADTGEPVVSRVVRVRDELPDGPGRRHLPDCVVCWSDSPAAVHRCLASDDFGEIPWPTPGGTPDGRSGNHRSEGFVVVAGPGAGAGHAVAGGHIADLAPTLCALLGVEPPGQMTGRVLALAP
jgi:predicted AlkP superfamily phosphohydrolase/phosphomutase